LVQLILGFIVFGSSIESTQSNEGCERKKEENKRDLVLALSLSHDT